MPGKGRRVASRQAEVGRRRRRQHRSTTAVSDGSSTKVSEREPVAADATEEQQTTSTESRPESAVQPRPAPAAPQRNISRGRLDRPAAYNYVMPEIRRISIMSGALLAVLVALSFVI